MPLFQLRCTSNDQAIALVVGFKPKHLHLKKIYVTMSAVPTAELCMNIQLPFLQSVSEINNDLRIAQIRVPLSRSTGELTTVYEPDIIFIPPAEGIPNAFNVKLFKADGSTPFTDATANLQQVMIDFEYSIF